MLLMSEQEIDWLFRLLGFIAGMQVILLLKRNKKN